MVKFPINSRFRCAGVAILLFSSLLAITSCNKPRAPLGGILYSHNHNSAFKQVDQDTFAEVLKKKLAERKGQLSNPQVIRDFYDQHGDEPVFVLHHLWNGDLQAVLTALREVAAHGINPAIFQPDELSRLQNELMSKHSIRTTAQAYEAMAELEILASNSLLTYANDLQFGILNPSKIYSRYFIKTARPDSAFMFHALQSASYKSYLDSIQPRDPQYTALQKALAEGYQAPGLSREETRRALLVNLERLRWKNKPIAPQYVYVNIPDFHLDVMDRGQSVLAMKVCVGEGRNMKSQNSLEHYDDTCRLDKPNPHETPLLSSTIHSVQVNPIWNIPHSIAAKEIIVEAAKDPYYLSNKNIDVYDDKGRRIPDPETIDWSKVSKENCPYQFKQEPGSENSLGKIKFLFQNKSNVYLHDTPAKNAFSYAVRAVSHGCVRLEKPLDLARSLFTDTAKFDLIDRKIKQDDPTPEDISLRPGIPVYITYVTCWRDPSGQLQFRQDVYGLDIVLYDHLRKFLPAS